MGSTLAMVKSQAEQKALAPKISQSTWMGLYRDPKDTSRWLWLDGTRPSYTNWGKGEPNNYQGTFEGCAEMWPPSNAWKWNDATCSASLHYVCETTGEPRISYFITHQIYNFAYMQLVKM